MATEPAPPAPTHLDDPTRASRSGPRVRDQGGFTLLELLVVIAILGVLAGVAVFAVGGLRDDSQEVACDADARVITTAQGAYGLDAGRPGTESELVAAGYLTDESQHHDLLVGPDSYDLVPVGACAGPDDTSELQTGLRIGDADEDGPGLERTPLARDPRVPCGALGPDTGDANQNPSPCDDQRLRSINRGATRVGPADTRSSGLTIGDTPCGPNRICDADMAPETGAGR